MKKIYLASALSLLSLCLSAQSRSVDVEYQKQSRQGVANDVPFPVSTIEKALEDTFKKLGYKSTSSKGFTVYKGVKLAELGPDTYDIYFMVDKKSRKDNENSTVTMMVSTGFDDFVTRSAQKSIFENSHNYLDSLRNTVAKYDLEQQIGDQETEVKKADKKSSDLQDEGKDLEKKKRKLEEQLEKNDKDQKNQVKEIEKQKQILETLKARRK